MTSWICPIGSEDDANHKICYNKQWYHFQTKQLALNFNIKKYYHSSQTVIEVPANHHSLPDFQRLMILYFLRIKDSYDGPRIIDSGDNYKIYNERHKLMIHVEITQSGLLFIHNDSYVSAIVYRGVLTIRHKKIDSDSIMSDFIFDLKRFSVQQLELMFET